MIKTVMLVWLSFLKVGSIAFGGGYAMIPVIMSEVVTTNQWLSQQEFLNIVSISQVTPGPIAVNAATYVGYKAAGIVGSAAATIGVATFSVLATSLLSTKLLKHRESPRLQAIFSTLNPVVLALIVSAGFGTGAYVKPELASGVLAAIAILWLWRIGGKSHWLMMLSAALGMLLFR